MRRSALLFVLVALGAYGAEDVALVYRNVVMHDELYGMVAEGRYREDWPGVAALQEQFGGNSYYTLEPWQQRAVRSALFEDPRAWGHVAIEFPRGNGPRYLGWEPIATAEEILTFSRFIGVARGPSETRPSARGMWVDAEAWVMKAEPLAPLHRIRVLGISDGKIKRLREVIAEMNQDDRWRYQITSPHEDFPPFTVNCSTAAKHAFRQIGYDLNFIPKSGSIMAMAAGVHRLSHSPPPTCAFILTQDPYSFATRLQPEKG